MTAQTTIRVSLDTQQAQRDLQGLQTAMQGAAGRMSAAMAGTATAVAGVATALVGASAAATRFAIDTTRQQAELAKRMGVTVEAFTGLAAAARQLNVDTEELADVMAELQQRAVNVPADFERWGIATRDLNGEFLSAEELLFNLADRIRETDNATVQLAMADELASDAGRRLLPVLRQGSDQLERMRDAAIASGQAIRNDTAEATLRLDRSLRNLSAALATGTRNLGEMFSQSQALTGVVDALTEISLDFVNVFSDPAAIQAIDTFFRRFSTWLGQVTSAVGDLVAGLGQLATLYQRGYRANARIPGENAFGLAVARGMLGGGGTVTPIDSQGNAIGPASPVQSSNALTQLGASLSRAGDVLMGVAHRGTSSGAVVRRRAGGNRGGPNAIVGGSGGGGPIVPGHTVRDLGQFSLSAADGATITFGAPVGGDPVAGFGEGLRGAFQSAADMIRQEGGKVHSALGEVGSQGMELFSSMGGSIADAFVTAFQGGDFGQALKQAVGQSITLMGTQLLQAGIMSLLLAPLAFIPFFGKLYGPPGKLAAVGAALTAGGIAMTGLGASMGGGGAPRSGGARARAAAGTGSAGGAGPQPSTPQFGPEFGGGLGRQPAVVNVTFNAPVDRRGVRRELQDILGGG